MADLRNCIGSAKFGIEAHSAPVGDFPAQPSQKDGLGRMCQPHWRTYTTALRKAALARKAPDAEPTTQSPAAAGVATKRASRVAAATPTPERVAKVRQAKAIVDAIDALPGPEHVAAIATDAAQAALDLIGVNGGRETPLGEQIDSGTEEADVA